MVRAIFVLTLSLVLVPSGAFAASTPATNGLAQVVEARIDMQEAALLAGLHMAKLESIKDKTERSVEDMYEMTHSFIRALKYNDKFEESEAKCERLCAVFGFDPQQYCSLDSLEQLKPEE